VGGHLGSEILGESPKLSASNPVEAPLLGDLIKGGGLGAWS